MKLVRGVGCHVDYIILNIDGFRIPCRYPGLIGTGARAEYRSGGKVNVVQKAYFLLGGSGEYGIVHEPGLSHRLRIHDRGGVPAEDDVLGVQH